MLSNPTGCLMRSDLPQLADERDRIFHNGSLNGHPRRAPEELIKGDFIRDGGLATIGGGNHFVELQWVEEIVNRKLAYEWGVKEGQIAFMIHSGSRQVGKYIGGMWRDRAQQAWPKNFKYPQSRLFPLVEVVAKLQPILTFKA